jgi:predicted nucleotidyltransferase
MRTDPRSCTLLKGVVGSTAYGLNHAESDTDFIGLYAVPAQRLLGLDLPDLEKAVEYKNPDTKFYEALHYCRLALKSNPSILELMWLESYNVRTKAGDELIKIRDAFPTQKYVRAAYLGYADQQYSKLLKDERLVKRAKNARHFIRLLRQGSQLYRTGELVVRLPNPEEVRDLGRKIAHGDLDVAKLEMKAAQTVFNANSALPENPDRERINNWLLGVRNGLFQYRHSDFAEDLGKPEGWV